MIGAEKDTLKLGKRESTMDYIINTPCGTLKGVAGRVPGTAAYKGIRYATAGRWEYPRQVTAWEGIYDATAYGNCSYQPRAFYNEEENHKKAFYYNEFRKGETYTYSEDCLFLNVFTPDTARAGDNLPVLVYIHGGGYTGGCGHEKHFDGPIWPAKGIIGVTLNYRLGPLGFACLPELKEEAGFTGNYGLYDQLTAIRWVRDNIAAFGGDPNNITVMGQSAGAMSVQQHCLSPLSYGLFHKAVMSSGGGVSRAMSAGKPEMFYEFWHTAMANAGCKNLEEFRALAPDKLFAVWQETRKTVKGGGCFPCIDGRLVVGIGADLVAEGRQMDIPYLCGSTSEDVMPPMIYKMGRDWCARQKKPSYAWFFDRKLPGDDKGAWHSADLWYWFGTLDNCWRPMEQKDRELSDQMTDYLANFCRTGNPNCQGKLPTWIAADKNQKRVLRLGEGDTQMGKASMLKLMHTMFTNKAVGE